MNYPAVLVVGTGAMGCLFAARLAAIGVPVTVLGSWREGLAALRLYGVTVVQPDGQQQAYPLQVIDDPAACRGIKYALVLVKSWQTQRAAAQLAECLAEDGVALTLQNGLGNQEILAAALGEERAAQGVTTSGATLLSSGRVRPGGEGVVSVAKQPRLKTLCEMLKTAGFQLEEREDVEALLWGKLLVNAAINPVTALLQVNNGELLRRGSARQLMADLAREVAAVAAAKGIRLGNEDPAANAEEVAERTAENHSSMYQDIQRGAATEIDAICGAVVAAGREAGVPTPVNYTVWKLVRALVEG